MDIINSKWVIFMDKKKLFIIGSIILAFIALLLLYLFKNKDKAKTSEIEATILTLEDSYLTVKDHENIIYTFDIDDIDAEVGSGITIEYRGILDKNKELQDVEIVNYTITPVIKDENNISSDWLDKGIFSDYYVLANNRLKKMSLDEKISQILLVRYPDTNQIEELKNYQFGGYLFFAKDFKDKTISEIQNMTSNLQKVAKIPILTAVDEEGGSVVRVSSNYNLVKEPFKSPRELYNLGGLDKIKEDTIAKSGVLNNLGLNLNLAPVVDVSTDPSDYMYNRSLGENTSITSDYAKTVIKASKGSHVSYTLKHFPGYGNNADTHTSSVTDTRSIDDIKNNDLPPFEAGIEAGAEAVLVSHNIVNSIDSTNPASLSFSVHNLLRNDLGFTGIIITDDIAMSAVSSIDDVVVKAVNAGNDLIITTDYKSSISSIKSAINNGTIGEDTIDRMVFRVLAWKYYKGMMIENQK